MHALTKGALGVAALALVGDPPPLYTRKPLVLVEAPQVAPAASASAPAPLERWRCPPRAVAHRVGPGRHVCLSLPELDAAMNARQRRLAAMPPTPAYLKMTAPTESIPLLPERPAEHDAYQLPVDPAISVGPALGGGDDTAPRLGVRLVSEPGAPVTLVDLEGEVGRPEVVLVGELYGVTVVVRHRVERDGDAGAREYLVFYGELDRPGPNVKTGARLSPAAVVGFLHDDEEEAPALYLEVRQPDRALAGPAEHLSQLVTKSVAVDPRNVLPLRP